MGELADKQRQTGRLFVDRIEDNGKAVLIGPVGKDGAYEKFSVPAKRGWKEGQYIDAGSGAPPRTSTRAEAPGDAGGFYFAPPTGMDPTENEPPRPNPDDTSLFHFAPPTGMDRTANAAPVIGEGRKIDTGKGEYLDNHMPVPAASLRASESQPWDWYAGGAPPNPTPPWRLPTDMAGPAVPTAAGPMGTAGRAIDAEAIPMPSERGRARHRRSRLVP